MFLNNAWFCLQKEKLFLHLRLSLFWNNNNDCGGQIAFLTTLE